MCMERRRRRRRRPAGALFTNFSPRDEIREAGSRQRWKLLPEKLDFTIMARIGCTDFQETKTGGKEREPAVPLRFIPAHCKFLDTRDDTTVTTIRELAAVLVSTFWGRGERKREGEGSLATVAQRGNYSSSSFFPRPIIFTNNTELSIRVTSYRRIRRNRRN